MVVVVVLGILAGIAVQRMGDVRNRAEEAAFEANVRLILGAANLAKTRNYGVNMMTYPTGDVRNGSFVRWQRPCQQPPVTQWASEVTGNVFSGWEHIRNMGWHSETNPPIWTGQDWNVDTFFESFPIGYAVEIIFEEDYGSTHDGYAANEEYLIEQIIVFQFEGDVVPSDDPAWTSWNPVGVEKDGNGNGYHGQTYPYHFTYATSPGPSESYKSFDPNAWRQVFPN